MSYCFELVGRGVSRASGGEGRSRSQSHRPLFNVSRVPGFALKREGGAGLQPSPDARKLRSYHSKYCIIGYY